MVRTARTRGSLSGLLLVLLGAWGGIAPFIGPYFGYGFTPGKTWELTAGRLDYSVIPGAVVLVAGLVILITRSRWLGGICAFLAACGGAWFGVGLTVTNLLAVSVGGKPVSAGAPIATTSTKMLLTALGFYLGTGALVVFLAALALGRFSIAAYKDYLRFGADPSGAALAYGGYQATAGIGGYAPAQVQYLADQAQYPSQYPDQFPGEQYPAVFAQEQYPAAQSTFSPGQSAYPGPSEPTQSASPFPPIQDPTTPTE